MADSQSEVEVNLVTQKQAAHSNNINVLHALLVLSGVVPVYYLGKEMYTFLRSCASTKNKSTPKT